MAFYHAIFTLVVLAVATNRNAHANSIERDEWFQRKLAESYNVTLQAYHPNPMEVVDHFNYHVQKYVNSLSYFFLFSFFQPSFYIIIAPSIILIGRDILPCWYILVWMEIKPTILCIMYVSFMEHSTFKIEEYAFSLPQCAIKYALDETGISSPIFGSMLISLRWDYWEKYKLN